MATDIKQAVKDILLWGVTLGAVAGLIAYLTLSAFGNDLSREQAENTCYCEVELGEVEDELGDGLVLEHWGSFYEK